MQPGAVTHTWNPNAEEAGAGGFQVPEQAEQRHSEALPQEEPEASRKA